MLINQQEEMKHIRIGMNHHGESSSTTVTTNFTMNSIKHLLMKALNTLNKTLKHLQTLNKKSYWRRISLSGWNRLSLSEIKIRRKKVINNTVGAITSST